MAADDQPSEAEETAGENDGTNEDAGTPPSWPIEDAVRQLQRYDLEEIKGNLRLGRDLAFAQAPQQIDEIISILDDLREENWDDLEPGLAGEIQGNVNGVLTTLDSMLQANSSDPNIHGMKPQLEEQLRSHHEFFKTRVKPRTLRAQIRREVEKMRDYGRNDDVARDYPELAQQGAVLREALTDLRQQQDRLARELQSQQAPVEAARDEASASGAEQLAKDYLSQASDHKTQWQTWGIGLVSALVVAAVAGFGLLVANRPPTDASNAAIVSHLAVDVLLIGLLLYAIRVAGHQFSVHRHLEAVSRNKASALSTFNRLVSAGSDPETRTAVASVLAQAVFSSEETGFIDANGSQVTLIERMVAPVAQRINPPN